MERKCYLIEPEHKKSTYDEQTWVNTLKSGKSVSVKVGNLFRWGSFHIDLNENEKEEIMKKEIVKITDYENFELIEMWDGGCDFWVDIVDEDQFTEQEQEEINDLIYKWPKEKCPEGEDEEDECYDEEKMILNGWSEDDCEYFVNAPIKLEIVFEN